jgi:hypothetical protein
VSKFRETLRIAGMAAAIAAVMGTVLHFLGRRWWCACGAATLWIGDPNSAHTSQHLLDPYSATHILHGMLLCGLLAWTENSFRLADRFLAAMALEALWEIVENTKFVIDRYRAATIAIGYEGDSIVNSLGDFICAAIGFTLAARLGWKRSIVLFVAIELVLLATIRDNLTLNLLMLVWPIDAIRAWQQQS